MASGPPALSRLIVWPSVLTLIVSLMRFILEVETDLVDSGSGGGGSVLGITWLVFVFGAYFGLRLAASGSTPRLRPAWVFALCAFVAMAGAVAWGFADVDRDDRSAAAFEGLRGIVYLIAAAACGASILSFVVWPRLALVCLCYAIPARLTVIGLTALAKAMAWDSHYTKLGPAGIEAGMTETMTAASVAQLGFWVPFTVVGGVLAGSVFGRSRPRRS
jgi:hypothetical protein